MDDKNEKALVSKGFWGGGGFCGNLFYILDLFTHLFNQYFELDTGSGDVGAD